MLVPFILSIGTVFAQTDDVPLGLEVFGSFLGIDENTTLEELEREIGEPDGINVVDSSAVVISFFDRRLNAYIGTLNGTVIFVTFKYDTSRYEKLDTEDRYTAFIVKYRDDIIRFKVGRHIEEIVQAFGTPFFVSEDKLSIAYRYEINSKVRGRMYICDLKEREFCNDIIVSWP